MVANGISWTLEGHVPALQRGIKEAMEHVLVRLNILPQDLKVRVCPNLGIVESQPQCLRSPNPLDYRTLLPKDRGSLRVTV